MTALAPFALLLAGFAALALSTHRHHRDLFGRAPRRARAFLLRCAGWALLAGALAAAIGEQGASVGIVLWFGVATAVALAVAATLSMVSSRKKRRLVGPVL
jgi:hypothetical protein